MAAPWAAVPCPYLYSQGSYSAVFPLQRAGREALIAFVKVVLTKVLMSLWGLAPDAFQPTSSRVCMLINKVCLAMWFWQPISRSGQQRMLGERIRNKYRMNFYLTSQPVK